LQGIRFVVGVTRATEAAAVSLRDGRRLTYTAIGGERDFPVLYLHGAIGSPRWRTTALESIVKGLGIRFVVVDRPGFGGSDRRPGRSVADYARDVEDFADAVGIDRFAVLGVSAGGPYALACAWALPERLTAAAAASPLAPPSGPGATPALRYLVPRVSFGTPVLGALAADGALRLLGVRSATDPDAMLEDYRVCRRPWGFDPGQITMPVTLWHGGRDPLVPATHALRLAGALPACATRLEPKAGHFFFGRQVAEIVGALVTQR
jgi:pimeloyl-ACP methyl ester carboxylesterase